MDFFFNELSLKQAPNSNTVKDWFDKLARLGKMLQDIINCLQLDSNCRFLRSYDFAEFQITPTHKIREFLFNEYDFSDPICIFLIGVFDAPYIEDTDELKPDYDDISISLFSFSQQKQTGIAAAYLKDNIAISMDTDPIWDTCALATTIHKDEIIDNDIKQNNTTTTIRHAAQTKHIRNCHLVWLAQLFNFFTHHYYFSPSSLLPLLELYKHIIIDILQLPENTDTNELLNIFYQKIVEKTGEEIGLIKTFAQKIAEIQQWEYLPQLTRKNGRDVYRIDNNLLAAVDTQHGEFEIHTNTKDNKHLGAVSFRGDLKPAINDRKLML